MITIIDYEMGNLGSVANMIKKIGGEAEITNDKEKILAAEKLILPGVGSFDEGIKNIKKLGLFEIIQEKALINKTSILGICLGAQLMTKSSEEGILGGLGIIDAKTIKFNILDKSFKVPHMGRNEVTLKKPSKLFHDMYPEPKFYFVHSYHFSCANEKDIVTDTEYGYSFVSSFEHENIYGVQFHPEKSHKFGMKVIENFITNI